MTFSAVFLAAAIIISGCSSSKTANAVSEDGSSAVAEDGTAKTDDAKKTAKSAKKKDEGSLLSQFDKSQLNSAKRRERYNDTLGFCWFIPRATARSLPDGVEVQYIDPA